MLLLDWPLISAAGTLLLERTNCCCRARCQHPRRRHRSRLLVVGVNRSPRGVMVVAAANVQCKTQAQHATKVHVYKYTGSRPSAVHVALQYFFGGGGGEGPAAAVGRHPTTTRRQMGLDHSAAGRKGNKKKNK
jgi:hypothetical protein